MRSDTDIAIFLPSLAGGGAEKVFVELSKMFAERGLIVDLLVSHGKGSWCTQVADTVRVVDLNCNKPSRSIPALIRYLRTRRPRAIMSALTHANIALAIAHRFSGVKCRCVLSERASLKCTLSRDKSIFDALLTRLLAGIVYRWADAVVAVSNGTALSVVETLRVSEDIIRVIYNPINISKIIALARNDANFPWHDSLPVMISVGRFCKQKDYPCLLRAFANLQNKMPSHLVILGEGEERLYLKRLAHQLGITEDVWMPGFDHNPFAYIARANLFVLSSRFEGLPNVLIEALALDVPVVSTCCPNGPDEILDNGHYGHLVPVGNDAALTEAMAKSLNGENPRFDRLEALERFDPEKVTNEYLQVLGFKNLEA